MQAEFPAELALLGRLISAVCNGKLSTFDIVFHPTSQAALRSSRSWVSMSSDSMDWTAAWERILSTPSCNLVVPRQEAKLVWCSSSYSSNSPLPSYPLWYNSKSQQETRSHVRPHISVVLVMGIYFLPELHTFRMKDSNALMVYHFLGSE